MEHEEAAELLGAYALDAVEGDEVERLEEHLRGCPRCRGELRAHREVAAALGNFGAIAPEGLWQKIAARVAAEEEAPPPPPPGFLSAPIPLAPRRRARALRAALGAVAAAVLVALGLSLAHLDHELNTLQQATAARGLAPAVAATALGPHQTVTLTAARSGARAVVEIAPSGAAYWVSSTLGNLAAGRTYQLWALVGRRLVSISLLGADPHGFAALRVAPSMSMLMVTSEPAGGSVQPTTPVLLAAPLPPLA